MSETNSRLMKFTGDLKNLPYRDLMTFADALSNRITSLGTMPAATLADALVKTAEEINPDTDPTALRSPRQGLAQKLGG